MQLLEIPVNTEKQRERRGGGVEEEKSFVFVKTVAKTVHDSIYFMLIINP